MCHTKANYENSYSLVRLYKRRLDITWFARVATKAEQFYTIFICHGIYHACSLIPLYSI